jgi:hypothetical protein
MALSNRPKTMSVAQAIYQGLPSSEKPTARPTAQPQEWWNTPEYVQFRKQAEQRRFPIKRRIV